MSDYLKDGTEVAFDDGENKGTGIIRGISSTKITMQKRTTYIVQILELSEQSKANYNYPCIPMQDDYITVLQ